MATRRVSFVITAKNQGFIKALDQSARRMDRFGRKMQRMGRTLSRTVTLPALAAGGAAVKMASDFQSSMTRIETLVGLSRDQVQGMRKDVLALAGETGRAPIELSEALFAVTSAGLRGEEAMETLEMSAKAAAIGLGETRDIARALTGVLQSYSEEGLTAAEATDTLIGVVREGNLEASELAPVLGRVTGIASQLGISFDQVGASVASFTRLGVSAEEAVTGLRGILNALLKQTPKAERALSQVGLTFDELRKKIQDEGLAQTLVQLVDSFEGNEKALASFAGRVRGLAAIMGTAGAQSESYLEIANNIADSSGNMDEGFARVSDTVQQRFNEALANLQAQAIELGTILLPIAEDIIQKIEEWVKWFGSLDEAGKKAVLRNTAIAAAAGPVLTIFGSLVRTTATLTRGLTSLVGVIRNVTGATLAMTTALKGVKKAMKAVPWLAAIGLVFKAGQNYKTAADNLREFNKELTRLEESDISDISLSAVEAAIDELESKIEGIRRGFEEHGLGEPNLEPLRKMERRLESLRRLRDDLTPFGMFQTPSQLLGFNPTAPPEPFSLKAPGGGNLEQVQEQADGAARSIKRVSRAVVDIPAIEDDVFMTLGRFRDNFTTVADTIRSAGDLSLPDKMFPPGSLGFLEEKLQNLRVQLRMATDPDVIRRLQEAIISTQNSITSFGQTAANSLTTVEKAVMRMAETLSLAAFQGRNLLKTLADLGKQLASRALVQGLGLLLSGGAFNIGSFIGSVFGVNDALITSEGDVVQFHPDDNILAMKDFSKLGGAGGSSQIIVPVNINGREVALAMAEYDNRVGR